MSFYNFPFRKVVANLFVLGRSQEKAEGREGCDSAVEEGRGRRERSRLREERQPSTEAEFDRGERRGEE